MSETIRVALAIPHEGMTLSEAYTNRLSMWKHLGCFEERHFIFDLIRNVSPETYEKVKADYLDKRKTHVTTSFDGKIFEFYHLSTGRVLTPYAREELAKRAEDYGVDYLFMIDDDMISPYDLFEKLYQDNVDIVAPLAFTRGYPHKPVLYACEDGWDSVANKDYFINHTIMNYPKDKLVECDAVGFGAVLIKMDVIKKMKGNRFMTTDGSGEDIYFCYQAKKHGFRVWMDTRIKLGHIGHPVVITEEYVEQVRKAHSMEIEKHYGELKKYDTQEPVLLLGD